jgi:hypothetical protein
VPDVTLGIAVRAHRRLESLKVVLAEAKRYGTFPGVRAFIHVLADRPAPGIPEYLKSAATPELHWEVSPFPILEPGRERFIQAQNLQLDRLEQLYDPDWIYVADDDFAFEAVGIEKELPAALTHPSIVAWFARVLFLQDAPNTYNPRRVHNSIRLFRHDRGFRHSDKRMLSMPDALHDSAIISGRTGQLRTPLFEVGGYTAEERQKVYDAYAAAGKVDPFTGALLSRGPLHTFPIDFDASYGPWRNPFDADQGSGT